MQHYEQFQVLGEVISTPIQEEDEQTMLTLKVSRAVSGRDSFYIILFPAIMQHNFPEGIRCGSLLQVCGTLQLDVMNDCHGSPTCVAFINVEEYALVQSVSYQDEDDYGYYDDSHHHDHPYYCDDGLDDLRADGYTEEQIWSFLGGD